MPKQRTADERIAALQARSRESSAAIRKPGASGTSPSRTWTCDVTQAISVVRSIELALVPRDLSVLIAIILIEQRGACR